MDYLTTNVIATDISSTGMSSRVWYTQPCAIGEFSRGGQSNKDYRRRIRLGQVLPVTRYGVQRISCHPGSFGYQTETNRYGEAFKLEWFESVAPQRPSLTMDLGLQSQLYNKIRNAQYGRGSSPPNLGVTVGEAHESIRMIGTTARSLASAFESVRKGDPIGAAKALGVVANDAARRKVPKVKTDGASALSSAWLSLKYGWEPLLKDVKSYAEYAAKQQQNLESRIKRRVTATKTLNSREFYEFDGQGKGQELYESSCTHRLGASWIEVEKPSTAYELGLTNPALIAWELMRYSFVVDWFMPIGTWLTSFDVFHGKTDVQGWYSWKYQSTQTKAVYGPSRGYAAAWGHAEGTNKGYYREPFAVSEFQWSPPPAAPIIPGIGAISFAQDSVFGQSVSHVLSGISLLQQAFKR